MLFRKLFKVDSISNITASSKIQENSSCTGETFYIYKNTATGYRVCEKADRTIKITFAAMQCQKSYILGRNKSGDDKTRSSTFIWACNLFSVLSRAHGITP